MRVWPEETARNVFPSGEKGVGPYENALNVVPYGERAVWPDGALAAKDTPRTGLSISDEMVPSTKPWMALPSGCIAGSRRAQASLFWQTIALLL